jgi:hypothetical protein
VRVDLSPHDPCKVCCEGLHLGCVRGEQDDTIHFENLDLISPVRMHGRRVVESSVCVPFFDHSDLASLLPVRGVFRDEAVAT